MKKLIALILAFSLPAHGVIHGPGVNPGLFLLGEEDYNETLFFIGSSRSDFGSRRANWLEGHDPGGNRALLVVTDRPEANVRIPIEFFNLHTAYTSTLGAGHSLAVGFVDYTATELGDFTCTMLEGESACSNTTGSFSSVANARPIIGLVSDTNNFSGLRGSFRTRTASGIYPLSSSTLFASSFASPGRYITVAGAANANQTESDSHNIMPVNATFESMDIGLSADVPVGNTVIATFRVNAATTSMTCTIVGEERQCGIATPVSVSVWDRVSVHFIGSDSTSYAATAFFTLSGIDDGALVTLAGGVTEASRTATAYSQIHQHRLIWNATENTLRTLADDMTVTSMYVRSNTAPGSGRSRVFTLRKDNTDTAITCTMADAETTCTASGSIAYTQGQWATIKTDPVSSPLFMKVQISLAGTVD